MSVPRKTCARSRGRMLAGRSLPVSTEARTRSRIPIAFSHAGIVFTSRASAHGGRGRRRLRQVLLLVAWWYGGTSHHVRWSWYRTSPSMCRCTRTCSDCVCLECT
ncbi:hypothetical protein DAEQUDRAFT_105040 [Daedalea quercina L-15889]|uniref:Uncharacterized protein n=1 Tax=Daedalea quercina L-15889 TaxID=1314783 RepID=A0A165KUE0_9APHY|nr:hypothetical protein DAEQUDRAFT_105040 [Daedalea quercina L-15889]